jgi:HEAT repeat protein/cyclophilin family peptidyl-prolyl cis-trans isomerase
MIGLVLALTASACASAPPPAPPPAPAPPSFEQKSSWILRLEDQRTLREPAPPAPPPVAPAPAARGRSAIAIPQPAPPPPPPDLIRLLSDSEARIRRRAALAVGRVGLVEGVEPLVRLLGDPDPEVRQMAAFALGLIGDRSARDPLVARLTDPSALMKGSAAEALGLIGDPAAAEPIGRMASEIVASGALAEPPDEALDAARDTPAAAFRLAMTALVRLKAYDALAAATLDSSGQPRVRWWPVAFAFQRLEDPRALQVLLALVSDAKPYTRAFAAKGLGAMKDPAAAAALLPLLTAPDAGVAIEAVRSLGRLRDPKATPALLKLLQAPNTDPHLRLEAATAVGNTGGEGASDTLIPLLADPNPTVRAAALRSLATIDPEGFVFILSGLDSDTHWTVRAALASILGTLTPEAGLPRLRSMLNDPDVRVVPAVFEAIAKLHPPEAGQLMLDQLASTDPFIRGAAADAIAQLKPPNGVAALTDAYRRGQADDTYVARAAALVAAAAYGADPATPLLTSALGDKDWAVRLRAAQLLKQFNPSTDAMVRIRPAPVAHPEVYQAARLISPPYSTQAYIDTDRGTIQMEMAMFDAPETVDNFVTLARKGFFDNVVIHRVVPDFVVQAGDPRADGQGGPGYAIRDELNERPYLRGTVGMALDWADTGGSQFFITTSPQPHLDAKYTVFGRVISGMDVVDRIEQGDVIRRVRIWDGTVASTPQH